MLCDWSIVRRGSGVPEAADVAAVGGPPGRFGWNEGRRAVLGTPEQVREGLLAVAHEYGAEEVMVVTIAHDHEARKRSYELIAEAFDLEPRGAAAATTASV